MDTNKGRAPPHRVSHRNLSPHEIPYREVPLETPPLRPGTNSPIGGNTWKSFGHRGRYNSTPPLSIDCTKGEVPLHLHREEG